MLTVANFVKDIIVNPDNIILIEGVKDIIHTNDKLGHLILFPKQNIKLTGDKYSASKMFGPTKHLGMFLFVGTNVKYFNHLFNNKITGKYYTTNIAFDQEFKGLISFEFTKTIKTYILEKVKETNNV